MRVSAYITVAVCLAWSATAGAQPTSSAVPPAPVAPRLLNVPTGHVQPAAQLHATGGAYVLPDRTPFFGLTLGLGGVADIDLEVHDRAAVCIGCTPMDRAAESIAMASAGFKMGVPEAFYGAWQPAMALAFRTSVGSRDIDFGEVVHALRAARLSAVVTKTVGIAEITVGVDAWDAENVHPDGRPRLHDERVVDRVRPLAGLVLRPPIYPRTRLVLDGSWAPVFDDQRVELGWLFGWGVRYQALSWGSIELDVRHREGGSLGDAEVSIRLNGSWNLLGR